jgi:hypothetical protein
MALLLQHGHHVHGRDLDLDLYQPWTLAGWRYRAKPNSSVFGGSKKGKASPRSLDLGRKICCSPLHWIPIRRPKIATTMFAFTPSNLLSLNRSTPLPDLILLRFHASMSP